MYLLYFLSRSPSRSHSFLTHTLTTSCIWFPYQVIKKKKKSPIKHARASLFTPHIEPYCCEWWFRASKLKKILFFICRFIPKRWSFKCVCVSGVLLAVVVANRYFVVVIIIKIIIIKQTLIGNIYKVTKERCRRSPPKARPHYNSGRGSRLHDTVWILPFLSFAFGVLAPPTSSFFYPSSLELTNNNSCVLTWP